MQRTGGRRLFMAVTALVVATAGTVVLAAGAGAVNPTITVTTTADVVDGSDGVLSLREAVTKADADAGADRIVLGADATYDLTRCGASIQVNEVDNSVGDLNATDAAGLAIAGPGIVHQTCTSRVIYATAGSLEIDQVTLTGGRSPIGAAVRAAGPLTFWYSSARDNSVGSTSDPYDAVIAAFGADVVLDHATVESNEGAAVYRAATLDSTAADLTVTSSMILDNHVNGAMAAGIISVNGAVLTETSVLDNVNDTTSGATAGGIYSLDAQLTDSRVASNTGQVGGISGGFHLVRSTLQANLGRTRAGGGQGVFELVDSIVTTNSSGFLGGGLAGGGAITRSSIVDNKAEDPVSGAPRTGGGIVVEGGGSLVVRNSTIARNHAQLSAGIFAMDYPVGHPASVELIVSTVAGNVNTPLVGPPQASDIAFGTPDGGPPTESPGSLAVESSVIGENLQAVPACVLQTAAVSSTGYNFGADDSCGLGSGAGDIVAGGDPMLDVATQHGGPTPVRWPEPGSPLIDAIPPAAPQCQPADQNGHARPFGPGCDIGAVELPGSGLSPGGGPFVSVTPQRVVDTRDGTGGLSPLADSPLSLTLAGTHGIPADATAVTLDVTGTDVHTPTFLTVFPGGVGPVPNVSNLNLDVGQTAANLVTVNLGAGGAVRFANAHGTINLVVDVVGYSLPDVSPVQSYFSPTPPTRLADSRDHTLLTTFSPHSIQSLVVAGGSTPVPADATAVMVNITATDVTAPTFVTAYPKGIVTPTASNLNVARHETRATTALVKIGVGHSISLFNDSGQANVIVDVVGYLGGGYRYVGLPPSRVIDTRTAGHVGTMHTFGPHEHQSFVLTGGAVPAKVKAVVLNVTVTDSVTGTFVTAYPTPAGPDTAQPTTSSVNVGPYQTNPNLVVVEVGADGKVSLYNQLGSANVVVDLVGYFW